MESTSLGNTASSSPPSPVAAAGTITCTTVGESARMDFLPRVFGLRLMIAGESAVFNWMSELCADYRGGYWDFVDLSNGGFYLRLARRGGDADTPMKIVVAGNGFSGEMSADAASIVATLFALNELVWGGADHLDTPYYLLRDLAIEHPERGLILRAID